MRCTLKTPSSVRASFVITWLYGRGCGGCAGASASPGCRPRRIGVRRILRRRRVLLNGPDWIRRQHDTLGRALRRQRRRCGSKEGKSGKNGESTGGTGSAAHRRLPCGGLQASERANYSRGEIPRFV